MSIHICRGSTQPATDYKDDIANYTRSPHALVWCKCCNRRRRARNAVVNVFYCYQDFFCAPGKGCKDPAYIAAKERREFRNRSAGQKRRWAKQNEGNHD